MIRLCFRYCCNKKRKYIHKFHSLDETHTSIDFYYEKERKRERKMEKPKILRLQKSGKERKPTNKKSCLVQDSYAFYVSFFHSVLLWIGFGRMPNMKLTLAIKISPALHICFGWRSRFSMILWQLLFASPLLLECIHKRNAWTYDRNDVLESGDVNEYASCLQQGEKSYGILCLRQPFSCTFDRIIKVNIIKRSKYRVLSTILL